MADTMALNRADMKQALIAIAIAAAGGLYWMYRQGKGKSAPNAYNAGLNNTSASSGSAGAIAPSSTINTYNVFPQVSSQMSTPNQFFNGAHGNVSPHSGNGTVWLSSGQTFSIPMRT